MARTTGPVLPVGLERLRGRIEHWRRTRERRTAMPAELWSEAVTLAQAGRPYAVARALGVNFEVLRRRLAEAEAVARATPSCGFVEFSGAQLVGASEASGTVIELSDGGGRRMTVRLAAGTEVDISSVVAAFGRQGT